MPGKPDSDRPVTEKSERKATEEGASASDSGAKSSLPPFLRLFVSSTARQANAMRKHVEKLLNHQRDILAPNALEAVQGGIRDMNQSIASGTSDAGLKKQMESLEATANKWLKPYPNAVWRENIEVLL